MPEPQTPPAPTTPSTPPPPTTPPQAGQETPAGSTPPPAAAPATPPPAAAPATPPPAQAAPPPPVNWTLTQPEHSPFADADLEIAVSEAKRAGITPAQAQELLNSRAEMLTTLREEYLLEAQADPEIGGARFEQSVADARSGVEWMWPNAEKRARMQAWFNNTGLGNHIEFIRAFAQIGQARREDRPLQTTAGHSSIDRKPDAEVLFTTK